VKSYAEFGYDLPEPPDTPEAPPGSRYLAQLGDINVFQLTAKSNRKVIGALFYMKNNKRVYYGTWSKTLQRAWKMQA
jgi:hypothetical protein